MMRNVITILAPLAALAACSGGQPANNAATGNSMAQSTADTLNGYARAQQAYLEGLTPAQGWQATPSGLRYRRTAGSGQGLHPTLADTVTITYAGKLIDGTQFDASETPMDLPLGALIPGWKQGIPLMAVGDTFEFAIPSDLGYGPDGSGPIPGGATLLFTVRLVDIKH